MEIFSYKQNNCKQGFSAVIPAKIFLDASPVEKEETAKKIGKALTALLNKAEDKKHTVQQTGIKDEFLRHDSDSALKTAYPSVTSFIDKTLQFIFTGVEAEEIKICGKQIGVSRGWKSDDAEKGARNTYITTVKRLVKETKRRLISAITNTPAEIEIYAVSKGKPDSKNYKIKIDKIRFISEPKSGQETIIPKIVQVKPEPDVLFDPAAKPSAEVIMSNPPKVKPVQLELCSLDAFKKKFYDLTDAEIFAPSRLRKLKKMNKVQ